MNNDLFTVVNGIKMTADQVHDNTYIVIDTDKINWLLNFLQSYSHYNFTLYNEANYLIDALSDGYNAGIGISGTTSNITYDKDLSVCMMNCSDGRNVVFAIHDISITFLSKADVDKGIANASKFPVIELHGADNSTDRIKEFVKKNGIDHTKKADPKWMIKSNTLSRKVKGRYEIFGKTMIVMYPVLICLLQIDR